VAEAKKLSAAKGEVVLSGLGHGTTESLVKKVKDALSGLGYVHAQYYQLAHFQT
jgi:hypothetical protein